jgi:hypothetical protein
LLIVFCVAVTGTHIHLKPIHPVTGGSFSARDVPVPIAPDPGHTHTLDIDGVFFDADGNATPEQALGGIIFFSGLNQYNFRWVATQAAAGSDGDGWSDGGEQRLGSEQQGQTAFGFGFSSTPEHSAHDVPLWSWPLSGLRR